MTSADWKQEAQEQLKAGQWEQASALFVQAAQGEGVDLEALLDRAEAAMDEGQVASAKRCFSEVFEHNPMDTRALVGLATLALFQGQLEEAYALLMSLLKMAPEQARGLALMGLFFEARGQAESAKDYLLRAVSADPGAYLAQFNLGRLLSLFGEHEEAIEALEKAVAISPASYDAHYTLGMARTRAGLYEAAVLAFEQARTCSPGTLDIYVTLADVHSEQGAYDEAKAILEVAIEAYGAHPALLRRAATVEVDRGDLAASLALLEQVLVLQPEDFELRLYMGMVQSLNDNFAESEKRTLEAIELAPANWRGHYQLGNLYGAYGMFTQSMDAYRSAIECAPEEEYRPDLNLAAVMIEFDSETDHEDGMGMFEKHELTKEAIAILEQMAPFTKPHDWRPAYNLALAYGKLGELTLAKEQLDDLLASQTTQQDVLDAAQALYDNLFGACQEHKLQALSSISEMTRVCKGED